MLLEVRESGPRDGDAVVCVHGLAQHGGVFGDLARALAQAGRRVLSVDLRGHGTSGYEPPWNVDTHVGDLLETASAHGVGSAAWVGHSFGGRLVATLAALAGERAQRLALLDPGFGVSPQQALAGAERDRQDWSFATAEGAANALLSAEAAVATPRRVVAAYVAEDLVCGADGRLRFRHSPGALVVAWSEMALPPPPVAQLPTLLLRPAASAPHTVAQDLRYRKSLGPLLKTIVVPNGHNVLWEAPEQTIAAVVDFVSTPG
jgi:lipase